MTELSGKFHVHLTLLCSTFEEHIKSWKTTVISLSKGDKEQLDVMLTKHYVIPSNRTRSLDDIKLDISKAVAKVEGLGYKVIRVKLEHESLPTVDVTSETYRECHIKLEMPKQYDLKCPAGFVKSKNPLSQSTDNDIYFINKRWYEGNIRTVSVEVFNAVASVIMDNAEVKVLEIKEESVVLDSNNGLDKWWA